MIFYSILSNGTIFQFYGQHLVSPYCKIQFKFLQRQFLSMAISTLYRSKWWIALISPSAVDAISSVIRTSIVTAKPMQYVVLVEALTTQLIRANIFCASCRKYKKAGSQPYRTGNLNCPTKMAVMNRELNFISYAL